MAAEKEVSVLSEKIGTDNLENPELFSFIVTGNEKMRDIFKRVERLATSEPVLGKSLLHRQSTDQVKDRNPLSLLMLQVLTTHSFLIPSSVIKREHIPVQIPIKKALYRRQEQERFFWMR
jgi:hypothetical protein